MKTWIVTDRYGEENRHLGTRATADSGGLLIFDAAFVVAIYAQGSWHSVEQDDGRTFWIELGEEHKVEDIIDLLESQGYTARVSG